MRVSGKPASYYSLAEQAFPGSAWVIDTVVAFKCFGVASSYLLVIGALFPQAFISFNTGNSLVEDRHFWQSLVMLMVVPMCLLTELRKLSYVSLGALLAIAYLGTPFSLAWSAVLIALRPFGNSVLTSHHISTLHFDRIWNEFCYYAY